MDPKRLIPLHEVRDHRKLAILLKDIMRRGWTGRPILAMAMGDGYQALTGSHRIAAAIEAGLEVVPVYILPTDSHKIGEDGACTCGAGDDCPVARLGEMSGDDDDRMEQIMAIGDEEAISLMAQEIKARE